MKKRVLSLILAAVMVCAVVPMAALAAEYTVTEVVPCKYDSMSNFYDDLAAVELDGKWGFIDKAGREVIPCKYDDIRARFTEGLARVAVATGEFEPVEDTLVKPTPRYKYGYIDKTGREVIPCQYDAAEEHFSEGLVRVGIRVNETMQYSFIDLEGNVVLSLEEYDATDAYFSEGLVSVRKDGKWGYIDKTGREVIPFRYRETRMFSEGVAAVCELIDGFPNWGYIDMTGKEVVPFKYSEAKYFFNGVAVVGIGPWYHVCWGLIDKTGQEILPCEYEGMRPPEFYEGLAYVETYIDDYWKVGFIDETGKEVIPYQYDAAAYRFYEGLAYVKLDGKYGFIDKTGQMVIPCIYEAVNGFGFHEGLAAVALNGKYGYIDKTGQEVIPCQYDYAYGFANGFAFVKLDNKWGVIDKTGQEVVPCKYDFAREYVYFSDGIVQVCTGKAYDGGKWGFLVIAEVNTAHPSTQTVDVDGTKVEFQCYALKDENGNDTNYIKLRDLADILNGSAAQFQVGWDGNITITTGAAYTKNGTEQNTPFSGQRTYEKTAVKTLVDGKETALDTFQLKDDNGGGYTYYKLRDLGKALGITVDWSGERGIFIETK